MFNNMWFFSLTFPFYKQFLWVSLLLNSILLYLNYDLEVIIFIKFFLTILLLGWYKTEKKNALVLFHNFRINSAGLFLTCLSYDLLLLFLTGMAYHSIV